MSAICSGLSSTSVEPPPENCQEDRRASAAQNRERQYRFLIEAYAIRPVVLHQHRTYVVASTVRKRRGDQRIGGSIRRVVRAQDLRDLRIFQLVVETVAAQEQPVAPAQRLRDRRGLRRSDAERLRDQVLVRMAAQLRLREILLLAQHLEI